MSEPKTIVYTASKTLAKFHGSPAFVRGVMGPIGSGKSVGMCAEIISKAHAQAPQSDGKRRSRWAVIRNTYPELKTTTIQTWMDWFGPVTEMVYGAPITGVVHYGDIELELYFLAMDKPKDAKKVLSLDLTGAWINEAREVPRTVLDAVSGRVGRYPSKRDGGPSWSGVIMDTNPPDDSHWWYSLAEQERPTNHHYFRQPSALLEGKDGGYYPNPDAENVKHHTLGYDYWLRQIPGKRREWINVYIMGRYGTVMDGKPVFPEYRDEFHCAPDPIEPMRGVPLILGWDWGRTPACVIGQMTPHGQLRCIDEIVVDAAGEGMGVRPFVRDRVKPLLATKYAGMAVSRSWGDPSGVARDANDQSVFDILAEEGIPTEPAPTNDPLSRQDAVIKFLQANVGGEPGYLLSPSCVFVRKGFLGGYRYAKLNVSGDERYKEAPEKNRYSHPHDAHQHMCQAARGAVTVIPTARKRNIVTKSAAGWT